jgi:hypothetical protein
MSITLYGIPNCEHFIANVAKKTLVFIGLFASFLSVCTVAQARSAPIAPHCVSPPSYWIADRAALVEHQTFHLITLDRGGSIRWNGRRVSLRGLQGKLRRVGSILPPLANQVGIEVADGISCANLERIRIMMERSLDCHAGMCRNGSLDEPPPPPTQTEAVRR